MRGRWWLLVWFTREERILPHDELAKAIADWHRYGDWRRPSRRRSPAP